MPPLPAESQAPPASSPVAPPALAADVEAQVAEHEVVITLDDRRWRVRGLARNLSFEALKVNLLVASGEHFHVDIARPVLGAAAGHLPQAGAEELQVKSDALKRDLGRVLLKLEELQEAEIREPARAGGARRSLTSEEEPQGALELLQRRPSCSTGSPRPSRPAAWSASTPTSWSPTWRRCRASSSGRWR